MTYEEELSQLADALLTLEEHEDTPESVRIWCSLARDAVIGWIIDEQTGVKAA